ncbi:MULTISPECIES: PBSX family phage terminase large subunit [Pseudomonadota]|uniref:PBSX family phage terminase large subunit n=1 Tax=Pseudomonadota TaxID=1224 RepID=UPI00263840FE|nr:MULTISPECIES: PBSX family phage terminase large subunit [Pseudomonadota]
MTQTLEIRTARCFEPLLKPSRYKGIFGGRGSGKSHFCAELLIEHSVLHPGTRAVCVREVQKSLKESAKRLIEDKIDALGVGRMFEVQTDQIKTPGGGLIIFQGMVDHTAESIKSLEGIDVAWIEEAQSVSQRSLDLLRPTIRKEGSEIWASWNPRFRTDPIDRFLRASPPEGSIVVRANYYDNPWFPATLDAERRHDEAGDPDRYRHTWLGDYEQVGDAQFIPAGLVERAMGEDVPFYVNDEMIMGVDVARFGMDETVIAIRRGRNARAEPWMTYRNLDTMEVAARVAMEMDRLGPDAVFVDAGGIGAGVVDRLRQLGRNIIAVDSARRSDGTASVKTANKRAEMWARMRDWLAQGSVSIPIDIQLEAQMTAVQYKFDANNAILLEKKEDMRKRGLPSPDKADALALTFAYPVGKRADDYDEWRDDSPRGRSSVTGY